MNPLDLLALTAFPCERDYDALSFETTLVESTARWGMTYETMRRADRAGEEYHGC